MLGLDDRGHYHRGREAMNAGELETAIRMFRSSMDASPHFKTAELLGECLLNTGRPLEAIVFLACAAGLGTKQSRSRFLLAQALEAVGDYQDALIKLQEALAMNPRYKQARELQSRILAEHPGTPQGGY